MIVAAVLVFGAVRATPGQAMTEGDRGSEMGGYYYFNPWTTPFRSAYKIGNYAVSDSYLRD